MNPKRTLYAAAVALALNGCGTDEATSTGDDGGTSAQAGEGNGARAGTGGRREGSAGTGGATSSTSGGSSPAGAGGTSSSGAEGPGGSPPGGTVGLAGGGDSAGSSSGGDCLPSACSDLVRSVDFETGDFTQTLPGDVTGDAELVTSPAHCGQYAVRLSAPPKADVRMWSLESRDLWLSYWVYLPVDWNGAGPWQMLHEWCPGVSPFCDIHVLLGFQDHSGIPDNLNLYTIWAAGETSQVYADVSLPRGQWVNIRSFVHWDMTAGEMVMTMDGEEIFRHQGRTTMNPTDPSVVSLEVGSYRDSSYAPSPMYLDDIVVCGSEF